MSDQPTPFQMPSRSPSRTTSQANTPTRAEVSDAERMAMKATMLRELWRMWMWTTLVSAGAGCVRAYPRAGFACMLVGLALLLVSMRRSQRAALRLMGLE